MVKFIRFFKKYKTSAQHINIQELFCPKFEPLSFRPLNSEFFYYSKSKHIRWMIIFIPAKSSLTFFLSAFTSSGFSSLLSSETILYIFSIGWLNTWSFWIFLSAGKGWQLFRATYLSSHFMSFIFTSTILESRFWLFFWDLKQVWGLWNLFGSQNLYWV